MICIVCFECVLRQFYFCLQRSFDLIQARSNRQNDNHASDFVELSLCDGFILALLAFWGVVTFRCRVARD